MEGETILVEDNYTMLDKVNMFEEILTIDANFSMS